VEIERAHFNAAPQALQAHNQKSRLGKATGRFDHS
jgi:hypothetical protein